MDTEADGKLSAAAGSVTRNEEQHEKAAGRDTKAIMQQKENQMKEAAGKQDYVLAGELQKELRELEKLEQLMNGAAARGDFISAGKYQAQIEQAGRDELPDFVCDLEIDVSCCKLSGEMLRNSNLESYSLAAEACKDTVEVKDLLNRLGDHDKKDLVKDFSCVIASSGTGKSQLAATAARSGEWKVVYLYVGSRGDIQEFYVPHLNLREELFKAVHNLSGLVGHGAQEISIYRHQHALFQLLCKCFFGDTRCGTVAALQDRVKEENLLVFLDEVPESSDSDFHKVMLLRNVLRGSGVSPILMSTHSGAVNAIRQGTNSRGPAKRWCRVFVELPKYQARSEAVWKENPWLLETERPLVAVRMTEISEKEEISNVVDVIQDELQNSKTAAWLDLPLWQLCQLFRSKDSDIFPDSYKHRIVGYHFGTISLQGLFAVVGRKDAKNWIYNQLVQFVNPEKEPVLFLALTTWKRNTIDDTTPRFFPLMDEDEATSKRRRLTIRGAFDRSPKHFTPNVSTENDEACKLSGDDLETLALASIALASLRWEKTLFEPVPIATFLADVFWFMSHQALEGGKMDDTAKRIEARLKGTKFSHMEVPTCPSAGSCFSVAWGEKDVWSKANPTGRITRPKDRESRDGILECNGETILHIECKNIMKGVDTKTLKEVMGRMRADSKVSLLFASDINGLFALDDSYQSFMETELSLDPHAICILVLEPNYCPRWLDIQSNQLILEPVKGKTDYLLVVIVTGAVGSKPSDAVSPSVPDETVE